MKEKTEKTLNVEFSIRDCTGESCSQVMVDHVTIPLENGNSIKVCLECGDSYIYDMYENKKFRGMYGDDCEICGVGGGQHHLDKEE